jgi:hypothetical protein
LIKSLRDKDIFYILFLRLKKFGQKLKLKTMLTTFDIDVNS